ncbi:MAG: S41 family peptidase [Petrimonas sp.]|uniref:S41 family peptidase n=1 Tax=Petrimonas sp. TaxID=2023866 RepID=UPI002B3F5C67|nr:S41 family peptidase [Petrimonas sp.]
MITCRVWGLLKYYHPNVTSGKVDWDKILMDGMEGIEHASTPEMVNKELKRMLDAAGKYHHKKTNGFNDSLKMNVNLCWLDKSFLDDALCSELRKIASTPVEQPSYYSVRFEQALLQNEKRYDFEVAASLHSMKYRLLSLFRYWNVIYYFFPHKYLMDQSWDKTLMESIFPFIEATDEQSYQIAFFKLAVALNDGHAYITMGNYFSSGSQDILEIMNGKTIVRVGAGGLQSGDIITHIGRRDIQSIRDSLSALIPSSTPLNREYRINGYVAEMISLPGIGVTITRDAREIRLYLAPITFEKKVLSPYRWLSEKIGYVDFSTLAKEKIDSIFQYFLDAEGIIFDLRKGVDNTYDAGYFSRYLSESNTPYYLCPMVLPDLEHPGAFCWKEIIMSNPDVSEYPRFQGKLVYLINESSQSALETIAWEGRTNFHAILIGRPTSGALGRVTWIPLPGNNRTIAAFSGFALFSLDKSELQRKGIVPDIEVYPTMESIKAGKDEILEAAIKYLNNHYY